jgi:hypothetical protein
MDPSPSPSLTELINGAAGLIVTVGSVFAATSRSFAILLGLRPAIVDRITATSFLTSAGGAIAVLAVDLMR